MATSGTRFKRFSGSGDEAGTLPGNVMLVKKITVECTGTPSGGGHGSGADYVAMTQESTPVEFWVRKMADGDYYDMDYGNGIRMTAFAVSALPDNCTVTVEWA